MNWKTLCHRCSLLLLLFLSGCEYHLVLHYTIVVLYGGEIVVNTAFAMTDVGEFPERVETTLEEAGYGSVHRETTGDMATISGVKVLEPGAFGAGIFLGNFFRDGSSVEYGIRKSPAGTDLVIDMDVPLGSEQIDQARQDDMVTLDLRLLVTLVVPGELVESNSQRTEALMVGGTPFSKLDYEYNLLEDRSMTLHLVSRISDDAASGCSLSRASQVPKGENRPDSSLANNHAMDLGAAGMRLLPTDSRDRVCEMRPRSQRKELPTNPGPQELRPSLELCQANDFAAAALGLPYLCGSSKPFRLARAAPARLVERQMSTTELATPLGCSRTTVWR